MAKDFCEYCGAGVPPIEGEAACLRCTLKPGDQITTNIGNVYVVGEIISNENGWFVLPEGGDEYTYLIPLENVTSYVQAPKNSLPD